MPIAKGLRAILGVFGPMLQAGIDGGRGAANMWQTYTAAYERIGVDRPPATLQDMNRFVVGLGEIMRTMANLADASDLSALVAQDHIAPPIGYEPVTADYENPRLLATFEVTIETEAGLVTRWSTISYNTILPATVGELRSDAVTQVQAQLDIAALEEGEDSPTAGGQVVSLGQMYLLGQGIR